MSYQVLARKWRPRTFREMVGQEHVLQALINALDHNRLHHAYLFTGTRGVGKTTIARILAKCLNCEAGVSSVPCGQCSACTEIAENRFVDLIEVDAASRTKVEDTRELLENVQYAPTRGRYKVYLIDEVHMLSSHSFNALLKTLEEPPPHVKFLLATTDPQKLPVTILSRCLQFNLKNMQPERIVQHLQMVLDSEGVPFEESALWQLGRGADGSMRDALSLTDQAIAYGSGQINEAEVRAMLGTIDRDSVYRIIEALASYDGKVALNTVDQMAEHAPDFAGALAEMLTVLHRIAIAQALPEAVDNSQGDRDRVLQLAQQLPSEDVQLFYQTALLGRRDLPLAPDSRAGFEMVLLRMLAFKPQGVLDVPGQSLPQANRPVPARSSEQSPAAHVAEQIAPAEEVPEQAMPESSPEEPSAQAPEPEPEKKSEPAPAPPPEPSVAEAPPVAASAQVDDRPPWEPQVEVPEPSRPEQPRMPEQRQPYTPPEAAPQAAPESAPPGAPESVRSVSLEQASTETWPEIYLGAKIGGVLQSTASNAVLVGRQGNQLSFILDENHSSLYDESHQQRLADQLSDYFGAPVKVLIQPGPVPGETPAALAARLKRERLAEAVDAINRDPVVQKLIEHFDASVLQDSVEPLEPSVGK
ncbi:DNA polymerase III subunit gamma/tau [Marinimicrobium alkaliphilum]|uniref:DNA polymerase III subunit gamma/tau n=1 Tax=Marinimicrobium alkaliphilum TaxID=2202654 RepID=UPI000DB981C9|nr:DNA polymerase III subunit gamma/tau [Marinimicrobium alkaliphilum]